MAVSLVAPRVLITGAASGLGRALALHMGGSGVKLMLTDRDGARLDSTAEDVRGTGATVLTQVMDVRDDDAWEALSHRVTAEWGGLDVLVNNAGVADLGPLVDTQPHHWERQLDINLMGVVRGCRSFVQLMLEQGTGHIVNIASFAGLATAPGMIAYNTAKGAVIAFSESLQVELAAAGVGVSVVCPAFFRTELTSSMDDASPDMVRRIERWMDSSGVTAEDVCTDIVAAIRADRFLVLTHKETRRFWLFKRLMPVRYRRMLVSEQQKRLARRARLAPPK